jgi:hypothetical protein
MVYFQVYSALLTVLVLTFPTLRDMASGCNTAAPKVPRIESVACVKKNADFEKVSTIVSTIMESKTLAEGIWGGQQVRLSVTKSGAEVEFSCAHGTIDQAIEMDNEGRFDARGTYEDESVGPVKGTSIRVEDQTIQPSASSDNAQPVRYTGRVTAQKMVLTVTITKTDRVIGTFSLIQGATPRLHKCH